MKQISIVFLIICMLFTVAPDCYAAEEAYLTITNIDVDYKTNQITVECKTTAGYLQRITAVIYDADEASPTWDNYVRAVEGVTDVNGECTLNLQLGTDMTEEVYTAAITGSGLKSANSKDDMDFHIIPLTESEAVLNNFNTADAAALHTHYSDNAQALEIEQDTFYVNNKTAYLNTLISMRSDDYENGKFSDLTQVANAFNTAREIVELGQCSSAALVGENLADNAQTYGINAADTDYVEVKDTANNLFKTLNTAQKAASVTDVRNKFAEAVAVAMVVTSDVPALDGVLQKYNETLGVKSMMTQYNAMTAAQKSAVARQLTDKSFTNAASVATAFSAALELVESNPTIVPDNDGSTGSGGGGGGGGGGGATTTTTTDTKPIIDTTPKVFSDLHQYEWAQESIEVLYKRGVINGYGDGTFGGNKSVTRSEFIKMVVTAFGVYDESAHCDFSDVADNNWACSFIGSAVKRGLVLGRADGTFGANDAITREDAAVMIYRAVNAINIALTDEQDRTEFSDSAAVSDYAREAVTALCKAKVINGFEDGSFAPKSALTRAQSAKIIYELIKRV